MKWLVLVCVAAVSPLSLAQTASPENRALTDDPGLIIGVGAATSWTTSGGAAVFAPNLAIEMTPIEHWLEVEVSISPFITQNATEWDVDFIAKKPWTVSPKAEFMLGVGPEWTHLRQDDITVNSVSGEAAADLMFWPTGRHRFGWYLQPAYVYGFDAEHKKSVEISVGLLIGFHRRRSER